MPPRGVAIKNTINVNALSSGEQYSTGTHLQNKVAERDLEFWIPRTKPYILRSCEYGMNIFYNLLK